MTTTVAVTGITGFLGRAIGRALGERGCAVRGIVRRAAVVAEVSELRVAALEPGAPLAAALAGADVIVHCAGGGRAVTAEDFRRNNLDTTEAILAAIEGAAAAARPRQFVLVSSVAAGGPDGNRADALDATECTARSSYGRHKWLAERAALDLARRLAGALQVTIVRAPAIYGPGDERFAPLVRAARAGWLAAPNPDAPLSMIDVDDCAAGIAAAIEHPAAGPRLYWVEDGERYSPRRMSTALARHFGKRLRVVRVPVAAIAAAALAAETQARVTGRSAYLTRDKLADLSAPSWICDSKLLRAETGFRTRYTFEARVPEIVASLGLSGVRA